MNLPAVVLPMMASTCPERRAKAVSGEGLEEPQVPEPRASVSLELRVDLARHGLPVELPSCMPTTSPLRSSAPSTAVLSADVTTTFSIEAMGRVKA